MYPSRRMRVRHPRARLQGLTRRPACSAGYPKPDALNVGYEPPLAAIRGRTRASVCDWLIAGLANVCSLAAFSARVSTPSSRRWPTVAGGSASGPIVAVGRRHAVPKPRSTHRVADRQRLRPPTKFVVVLRGSPASSNEVLN